jgi:DNA-binding response OmpR family regulator
MNAHIPTILVVDDETSTRKRIRALLHHADYNVVEARDFAGARALFERRRDEIDLMLIDVSIPGNNGCELAKAALAAKPGVQVLLMSGLAGAQVCRFYGIPATDVHFLEKPFRDSALLARVKYILGSAEPLTGTATGSASG